MSADLIKVLEAIAAEARMANDVIAQSRHHDGSGRVKVATSMHRIGKLAADALAKARGDA